MPPEFVLYGGTALALPLGHRESVDFDFFSDRPLDARRLAPDVPFLATATVTQREPNTFSCVVDRGGAVKLSFFGLPWLTHLAPPLVAPDNGLRVASLLDIAAAKAAVVQQQYSNALKPRFISTSTLCWRAASICRPCLSPVAPFMGRSSIRKAR
ncbi:MAG TPA: nucleotidyl transferase AbiEii/AbiGii toxin family protein [Methylocystis sp.]|nr:nucleotidyl transferase AbiEii/AbiGii toxin family protein [Methylocystis sp.]